MKITIDLPDELLIAAKKSAAGRRTTLREIFERGLKRELASRPGKRRRKGRIRWFTAPGGLPPGLDISSRDANARPAVAPEMIAIDTNPLIYVWRQGGERLQGS